MKLEKEQLLNKDYTKIFGRYLYNKEEGLALFNSVSGIRIKAQGKKLYFKIKATNYSDKAHVPYIQIIKDEDFTKPFKYCLDEEYNTIIYELDDNLDHIITLYKQNEAIDNTISIMMIEVEGTFLSLVDDLHPIFEIYGDSTIAGFGNLTTNGIEKSTANSDGLLDFSFLAAKKLNADVHTFTGSGWSVRGSIWTTPKDIGIIDYYDKLCVKNDILWDDSIIDPELIIISYGTNDMYYINEIKELVNNRYNDFVNTYEKLLKNISKIHPNKPIIMIYGSINEEGIYHGIEEIFNKLKKELPLYLCRLHGDNLGASGHPSLEAHHKMSDELVEFINKIRK